MVRIVIKETGEVRTVDRNIAHDLIERGIAKLYKTSVQKPQASYSTRQLRPKV